MKQKNRILNVKTLISFDSIESQQTKDKIQQAGLNFIEWQDIIEMDYNDVVQQCTQKSVPFTNDIVMKPESIFTICYTSSTTGVPKGALISNQNIISNARGFDGNDAQTKLSKDNDCYISYLPLAHAMERALWIMCVYS